jgi:hypothetical protein
VCGDFQRFQSIQVQLIMDAFGEPGTDTGHGPKQLHGVHRAPQPLELAPAARDQHLGNGSGNSPPDVRQSLEAGDAFFVEYRPHAVGEPCNFRRGVAIGVHAERVRTLRLQQLRGLPQQVGDLRVLSGPRRARVVHIPPPLAVSVGSRARMPKVRT